MTATYYSVFISKPTLQPAQIVDTKRTNDPQLISCRSKILSTKSRITYHHITKRHAVSSHQITFMPSIQVSIASGRVRMPWPHTKSNDANHPAALAQMSTDTLSQLLRMLTSVLGTFEKTRAEQSGGGAEQRASAKEEGQFWMSSSTQSFIFTIIENHAWHRWETRHGRATKIVLRR